MNQITISPDSNAQITEIYNEDDERIGLKFESKNDIEVSDRYHTMSELYEHRYALFCALVKLYDGYKTPLGSNVRCIKSDIHNDGTKFEGHFIVMMLVKKMDTTVEQISYHLPNSWWDKFNIIVETPPVWDGHNSKDVIERLLKL